MKPKNANPIVPVRILTAEKIYSEQSPMEVCGWLECRSIKEPGRRSRDGQKRYINGVSSSRHTAWDWLIYKIRFSGNSDYDYRTGGSNRQALIGILLLFVDKEHLTAEEQREIEQIKEIADFVLK